MAPHRYAVLVLLLAFALVGGVAGANWLVDPYGLFNSPLIEGFNGRKSKAHRKIRFVKAWQMRDRRAEGLIVGSSRSEIGLRPDHSCWPTTRNYNGALSGANMYEVRRYYQHATAVGPVDTVVVGLDFFMFNKHRGIRTGFDEDLLALDPAGRPNRTVSQWGRVQSLFSAFTLVDSVGTVAEQKEDRYFTADGRLILLPLLVDKPRRHFRKTEQMFHTIILFPGPARRYELGADALEEYAWMLREAHSKGRTLHLVISPMHARFSMALHGMGMEPTLEAWKRQLVAINDGLAKEFGAAPFPLWDFSGYNEVNNELVPKPSPENRKMSGFRDPSHYTTETGDRMLNQIFGCSDGGFGVRLKTNNLESHLADQRLARDAYMKSHPDDVAELKETAAETVGWRQ